MKQVLINVNNAVTTVTLSGDITHKQYILIWQQLELVKTNAAVKSITLDMANVKSVDSSALALLLAFQRLVKSLGKTLTLQSVPTSFMQLAKLYGIS